jgi:oxygen-independent coproporphyrinogen-3 oxidase
MAPLPPGAPLGIYLHIPFCAHICPYCDFNTYAGQDNLIPSYVDALVAEIERQGAVLAENGAPRAAETIYIGGGTPSLLPAESVARIVAACRSAFAVAPDAEVTLEANPTSVDEAVFAGLLEAGINRLSLGVQTQHRRGLRTLGRNHEAADAAAAYRAARAAGFANISLDLIFAWPEQTPEMLAADLETVVGWEPAPEHLSCYSLIVEPGTPMADAVARGILRVPDDDASADLYELVIETLARAGYSHYEVANWARSPELASRHNRIYWRNGEYVGAGAGAHGFIGGQRTMQHLLPAAFIAAVERGEPPVSNVEEISPETSMGETMMLGLRLLDEGVCDDAFLARHGISLDSVYGGTIAEMTGLGLIERRQDRVRLTPRGLMLANDVAARFLP